MLCRQRERVAAQRAKLPSNRLKTFKVDNIKQMML